MESNTPATQSFSSSNPDEDKPMRNGPIQDTTGPPESSKSAPALPPASAPATATAPGTVSAPVRPKGPNVGAVVLGLVALVLAAGIIATEAMNVRVDWVALGPGAIIGVGVLLVVLGAVGLARRRDEG